MRLSKVGFRGIYFTVLSLKSLRLISEEETFTKKGNSIIKEIPISKTYLKICVANVEYIRGCFKDACIRFIRVDMFTAIPLTPHHCG